LHFEYLSLFQMPVSFPLSKLDLLPDQMTCVHLPPFGAPLSL
jgi:hypothetical protein